MGVIAVLWISALMIYSKEGMYELPGVGVVERVLQS